MLTDHSARPRTTMHAYKRVTQTKVEQSSSRAVQKAHCAWPRSYYAVQLHQIGSKIQKYPSKKWAVNTPLVAHGHITSLARQYAVRHARMQGCNPYGS